MSDPKETEADWTKGIKSETVCQYFYVLFFIIAVYAGLLVLFDVYLAVTYPKVGWTAAVRTLPVLAIAVTNALFLYILCARSLLKEKFSF